MYPNLFPYGDGDYNMERRGKKPDFTQWIQHCMNYHDGRFRRDPIFPMVVCNQLQRRKCLTMGNIVAKDPEIQNMEVKNVKEAFSEGNEDSAMAKKIMGGLRYYGQTIKGSGAYFQQKSKETMSYHDHIRYRSKDTQMFNLFCTYSVPDLHSNEIHEVYQGNACQAASSNTFISFFFSTAFARL